MIHKFFTLRVVHPENGMIEHATWKQRFQWLLGGCKLRDEKVVRRFCKLKRSQIEHS